MIMKWWCAMFNLKRFASVCVCLTLFTAGTAFAGVYWLPDYLDKNLDFTNRQQSGDQFDKPDSSCTSLGYKYSPSTYPMNEGCVYFSAANKVHCYKGCKCNSQVKYDSSNCTGGAVLGKKYAECNNRSDSCTCPTGYTLNKTCGTGYTLETKGAVAGSACGKCNQRPCSDGGYYDSNPDTSKYKCSSVTYGGKTCQSCYQPQCTEGGYQTGSTKTGYICKAKTYYGRSCYDCSTKDLCYDLTDKAPCTYGCETPYSQCTSKCSKCYTDNCHNRADNKTAIGCKKTWADCPSKCEVGDTCSFASSCAGYSVKDPSICINGYDKCEACGSTGYKCKPVTCNTEAGPVENLCGQPSGNISIGGQSVFNYCRFDGSTNYSSPYDLGFDCTKCMVEQDAAGNKKTVNKYNCKCTMKKYPNHDVGMDKYCGGIDTMCGGRTICPNGKCCKAGYKYSGGGCVPDTKTCAEYLGIPGTGKELVYSDDAIYSDPNATTYQQYALNLINLSGSDCKDIRVYGLKNKLNISNNMKTYCGTSGSTSYLYLVDGKPKVPEYNVFTCPDKAYCYQNNDTSWTITTGGMDRKLQSYVGCARSKSCDEYTVYDANGAAGIGCYSCSFGKYNTSTHKCDCQSGYTEGGTSNYKTYCCRDGTIYDANGSSGAGCYSCTNGTGYNPATHKCGCSSGYVLSNGACCPTGMVYDTEGTSGAKCYSCPSGYEYTTVTHGCIATTLCDSSYSLTSCPALRGTSVSCGGKCKYTSCKTGFKLIGNNCIAQLDPIEPIDPPAGRCGAGLNSLICNGRKYCCPSSITTCLQMNTGVQQCFISSIDEMI